MQILVFYTFRFHVCCLEFSPSTQEYADQLAIINKARDRHVESLIGDTGEPQLNICDNGILVSTIFVILYYLKWVKTEDKVKKMVILYEIFGI